jgi:hypothetical protein
VTFAAPALLGLVLAYWTWAWAYADMGVFSRYLS